MYEIDFYLELADEAEINRILKGLNESVGDNLTVSKMKIKKAYNRGQIAGNIKGKSRKSIEPFNVIFNKHRKNFNGLNEKEFFVLMQDKINILSNYEKFANSVIYYPNKTNEYLPIMKENYKNNKPIFDLGYTLDSDEEAANYIIHRSPYSSDKICKDVIEETVGKYLTTEDIQKIKSYSKQIGGLGIREVYNMVNNNEFDIPTFLVEYIYSLTHERENPELVRIFLIEILTNMAKEYKNKEVVDETSSASAEENQQLFALIEQYKSKINELEEECKALKKSKREMLKSNKTHENELKELKTQLEEIEKKKQELIESIKNESANEISKLISEKTKIENELNIIKESIRNIGHLGKEGQIFAFIHSRDVNLAQKIFPEVLFIPSKQFKNANDIKYIKGIKHLYIQRQGVLSSQIATWEHIGQANNIIIKTVEASCEKEIIEQLARIKLRLMEG
jgi:hypothetical protein